MQVKQKYTLQPHHNNPECELTVSVTVTRDVSSVLEYRYTLVGDLSRVDFPVMREGRHADRLWTRTCFECFFLSPDGQYVEFNFSPSSEWAVYEFKGYREGMQQSMMRIAPKILCAQTQVVFELNASVDLSGSEAARVIESSSLLNLATVIRLKDDRYCYFSLGFGDGEPDFHRRESFVVIND
jgi:hypothetical protein